MITRDYVETDYEQILTLITAFKQEECSYDSDKYVVGLADSKSAEAYTAQILKDHKEKDGYFYVAIENDQICGFVMGIIGNFGNDDIFAKLTQKEHRVGWVGILYVAPEYRRQGVAQDLLVKAKEYLRTKGCQMVKLHALAKNPAVGLYEKTGFRSNSVEMIQDL